MRTKNLWNRVLAVTLSATMLLTAPSGVVFAENNPAVSETGEEGETEEIIEEKFEYVENDSGTITITGYIGDDTEVTIPEQLAGKNVTDIGSYTFSKCDSLTMITIPENVEHIEAYAFQECANLKKVTIPEGGNLVGIGKYAFAYCMELTDITIPDKVMEIGESAFYKCEKLTEIVIPEGITNIEADTFAYCEGLTSITIPENVMKITENAFYGCSGLMSIEVEEDNQNYRSDDGNCIIENDSNKLLLGCSATAIPESVIEIGNAAFAYSKELTEITIPENVTKIGESAFEYCENLTKITIPKSVMVIGSNMFTNNKKELTIYCYTDSAAHEYAVDNDILYELLDKEKVCLHENTGYFDATTPTCEQSGYEGDLYCLDCNELLKKGKELKPIGHKYKWRVTKKATMKTEGRKDYICSNCNHVSATQVIAKLTVTYTVKFNGNGNTSGSMKKQTHTYGKNKALSANQFKKTGYTFVGWNTEKDGSGKSYRNKESIKNLSTESGGKVTLYAQWKKTKYEITYKLNKGTNNKKNPSSYTVETKTITLKKPTRKGYTFKGWYSDKKCTKKVIKIKKGSTGKITLYAKWEKNKK